MISLKEMLKSRRTLVLALFFVGGFLVAFVIAKNPVASAWQNPTALPPLGGGSFIIESDSPANTIYIQADGKVGIGVLAPSQKLDISDSISLPTTTSATSGVIYKGADRFIHNFSLSGTDGNNTFLGINAGNFTMTGSVGARGSYNTGVGQGVLSSNSLGWNNTAVGSSALNQNTVGVYNSAIGAYALEQNISGQGNSAVGLYALQYNTTANHNSAIGVWALQYNTTGYGNSAMGAYTLIENSTGYNNTALGVSALQHNATGYDNVAIGSAAGYFRADGGELETANNSVYIGARVRGFNNSDINSIVIGADAVGIGANTVVLGNNNIVKTALKGNVGIGTISPGAKLEVAGQVKITGGTPGVGKVLTSDSVGLASWQTPATVSSPMTWTCTRVSNRIDAGAATATCAADYRMLSGGCYYEDTARYLFMSYPTTTNGWYCQYSAHASGYYITAYAWCCK
jgi:hypothetical protein